METRHRRIDTNGQSPWLHTSWVIGHCSASSWLSSAQGFLRVLEHCACLSNASSTDCCTIGMSFMLLNNPVVNNSRSSLGRIQASRKAGTSFAYSTQWAASGGCEQLSALTAHATQGYGAKHTSSSEECLAIHGSSARTVASSLFTSKLSCCNKLNMLCTGKSAKLDAESTENNGAVWHSTASCTTCATTVYMQHGGLYAARATVCA